ncbi:MAG: hypothetical protein KFF50_16745, partial [Desulfatitalea sp.]|nr:hypothetical protein [Desulfatitalea sp.]
MSSILKRILLNVGLLLLFAFGCAAVQQVSSHAAEKSAPYQVGQWQPSDQKILNQWVEDLVWETNAKPQP